MKGFLWLVILILVLVVVGWITFTWTGDRASVHVETDKIERDTRVFVEGGKEMITREEEEDPPDPSTRNEELDEVDSQARETSALPLGLERESP